MIEIPGKYQASFFGDFGDIRPTADSISKFLDMFRDNEFLPSTFQEIKDGIAEPRARLRLSSQDHEWLIDFNSERIVVNKLGIKAMGANMGTVEEFAKKVVELTKRILGEFPKKGTRLALVTEGLMKEMSAEKLGAIYQRVFRPVPFYGEHSPYEWKSRSVAKIEREINAVQEVLNVICDVNRIHGEFTKPDGMVDFDRIQVGFDINTHQGNKETRFEIDSAVDFYQKAIELRSDLLSQLEGLING
jgi:hypothetical protein